jgi:hypothetical protein
MINSGHARTHGLGRPDQAAFRLTGLLIANATVALVWGVSAEAGLVIVLALWGAADILGIHGIMADREWSGRLWTWTYTFIVMVGALVLLVMRDGFPPAFWLRCLTVVVAFVSADCHTQLIEWKRRT